MGWTFARLSRDQLIRELIATQDTERARREVIEQTLVGNVLWTVVRITAKQTGVRNLSVGESVCFIGCDLLGSSGGEWGYKSLTEAEHPYEYTCPLHYLELVPMQCAEWRRRVRAHHGAPASDRCNDPTPA